MLKKFPILPAIAFVSGFSLMTFELAAARVLAPSIGSSTYVWTSVIGVIIAALSLGYWIGGKLADRRNQPVDIAWLCIAAALTITLTLVTYLPMLEVVVSIFEDARIQGVVASLILFAPTSFLIGALSPYLVKLKITSLQTSGQSVASLSALESIGGIIGTFTAGFILFGYIGSRETFAVVVLLLLLTSWLLVPRIHTIHRLAIAVAIAVACLTALQTTNPGQIDTPSNHYSIVQGMRDDQTIRGLVTGPHGTQSGIYVDQPDKLLFWYAQEMAEIVQRAPERERILVLGGGAFTVPEYLAREYPDSIIDAVEVDPALADIARQYFDYEDPANVNLIFEDARTYVNQTERSYDLILVDVYGDTQVPFSMTTQQYGQHIEGLLRENGLVVANIIAQTFGQCRETLQALDAPYRAVFDHVAYSMEDYTETRSNMLVVYSDHVMRWPGSQPLALPEIAPFTDNYAPAERLQQQCRNA